MWEFRVHHRGHHRVSKYIQIYKPDMHTSDAAATTSYIIMINSQKPSPNHEIKEVSIVSWEPWKKQMTELEERAEQVVTHPLAARR